MCRCQYPLKSTDGLRFIASAAKAVHLIAIRHAAVILAPSRLLRVAEQIRASDMVVVADLGAAHAAEKFLRPIRASAVELNTPLRD